MRKLCECGHGSRSHKHHVGVGYVGLCVECACHAWHEPTAPIVPHDGKPPMRPHSIPGWWQLWSGGICIALLRPEDVEPIINAWLQTTAPEHHDTASHTRCVRCGDPAGDHAVDDEELRECHLCECTQYEAP